MDTKCYVNGSRITTLGFTNFTTSLTTEPLSWTVGYQVDPTNFRGNGTDERFYYLGTPPALDLNSISSLSACALTFVGIQSHLSFVPPGTPVLDMSLLSGTCGDALGATCVSDLIQQSLRFTNDLNGNGTFQCSSLANMLQNDPPASCSEAGPSWGNILVKGELEELHRQAYTDLFEPDLTGPEAASKIELGTCHPTVNQTYDIRIVENQNSTSQLNFFGVITPILTVFAPVSNPSDSDVGPTLSTSEAHLSCMKPITNKRTAGLVVGGDASKSLSTHASMWLLLGLSLWAMF